MDVHCVLCDCGRHDREVGEAMRPVPVLLVTHNRLEYSKQALESICNSPGLPIELMIVDNASTDGTVEWLAEIADRQQRNCVGVSVVLNSKNLGLAPVMNTFFRKYSGQPYVVKVDNDTVLPDNWLVDLMEVFDATHDVFFEDILPRRIGAVSGTCLRPPGLTAREWYSRMLCEALYGEKLYFNPACLGTGVLINMDMIRERGLLFERFPRSPEAGPDDPCLISGWGAYIQEASAYTDWKFAMYSKVPVKLLNLKEDQVLSNDYPEYDAEVAKIREDGNRWWESVGGIAGVRKYVQEHGGLEPLHIRPSMWEKPSGVHVSEIGKWPHDLSAETIRKVSQVTKEMDTFLAKHDAKRVIRRRLDQLPPSIWTEASELDKRSTFEFWDQRVREHGTTASTFLTTPQARVNEFTERHMEILHDYARNRDCCEVGCGWGRMSLPLAKLSKSYVGVDFIPELVEKAHESMPDLDFRVAAATRLPFENDQFDLVVVICCLSSFAAILNDVLTEMKRVLRPHGRILFLEEDFARVDWKLTV
jgi:glycosyltransferase involved in cell wall biosynthesis